MAYQAVAILPGEKPADARTKFSVTCFLRYGVHTIFYGSGRVPLDLRTEEEKETDEVRGFKGGTYIDWLCRVLSIVGTMSSQISAYEKNRGPKTARDLLREIAKKVGTVSVAIDGVETDLDALSVLYGQVHHSSEGALTDSDLDALLRVILRDGGHIAVCEFTPIQLTAESRRSQHYSEKVFIPGNDFVGFATGLLSEALRVHLLLQEDGFRAGDVKRDVAALRIATDGLFGAFLTGALNAQLMGLEKEWRLWWKNWQESPPYRLARFQSLHPKPEPCRRFRTGRQVRHRVDSIITRTDRLDFEPCGTDPIRQGKTGTYINEEDKTRIRAFDTFIVALQDGLEMSDLEPSKRLLVTVAAHRGLGKGTFLSAMSSARGLSLYDAATWERHGDGAFLFAACFINLSFSTEIASCFDSLILSLREATALLQAAEKEAEQHTPEALRFRLEESINPSDKPRPYELRDEDSEVSKRAAELEGLYGGVGRTAELAHLFDEFKAVSEALSGRIGHARFMIYLTGLELVFDAQGAPKNHEVEQLFVAIFGKKTKEVPVDFVFIGSEGGLGAPFSLDREHSRDRGFALLACERKPLPPKAKEQIRHRIANGRLKPYRNREDLPQGVPLNHVHYARPVSPGSLLVDNFPLLAMALYLNRPPEADAELAANADAADDTLKEAKELFGGTVKEGREESDRLMQNLWSADALPEAQEIDAARREIWNQARIACAEKLLEHGQLTRRDSQEMPEIEELLRKRLKIEGNTDREEWRRIRRHIGNNRFSTTIILAMADFIIVQAPDGVRGAEEAEEFVRSTVDQVRNVGWDRREELILQIVLERYRRYHVQGNPDLDIELHQLLLKHLAVIGSPTSSAVLVRLPEFRDYFKRLNMELAYSRRRFLTRALTVMAYRGLTFRLDPHPRLKTLAQEDPERHEDDHWPARKDYRYALHRTVQTYAIGKLGLSGEDPVRSNSFAPRLYASMPSMGTGLSYESYQFLRSLLIGLSQYPDVQRSDTTLMPWLFSTNTHSVKVQALRAALSTARSTLSVATLSRFPGLGSKQPSSSSPHGLLENYKLRMRWIIRMAWELVDPKYREDVARDPAAKIKQLNPLYRDEIIWVYNELGVIALAQGNMNEALGFLRQAAELNETVEGRARYGPVHDYIALNHAIVQMERGRLGSAEGRLRQIRDKYRHSDQLLGQLAEGYLCVIDHIRGRFEGLSKRFKNVVEALQALRDNRASALFSSHYARFLAFQGEDEAEHLIGTARALAETGGQEDVRHHIEISRLTIEFRKRQRLGGPDAVETPRALQQLRDIEMYGRRMGIWSLQVDSLKLRAEILLLEGETSSAGALLVRAMAIARRYRMMLRLNAALSVYARLLQHRDDAEGAKRHALLSLEMAKTMGYSHQTSSAQRTLAEIDP